MSGITVTPGWAEGYSISTASEIQTYPGYIQDYQKIRRFEVGLSADNPDTVIFSAIFVNGITANSVAQSGSRTTLLRVKVFYSASPSSSAYSQLTIDSPSTPYQGETKLPAVMNNPCGAKTWMPSGKNAISFEISRSCLDLPDKFWTSLFLDVDVNQSNQDFINIPEVNAMGMDFSKFPKPKKPEPKKDQVISGFSAQQSYTLDFSTASFTTTTNSGLPIQIFGKTNSVCLVTSSTTISLVGVGTCVVALNSPGNDLWNPSPEITFSFNVLPKKVVPKIDQKLYFNPPGTLYENSGETRLDIYTDSQLDVQVISSTPDVCMFPYSAPNNTVLKIYSSGTCAFTVKQAGNDRYNPREGTTSIQILAVAKPAPNQPTSKPAPLPSTPKAPQKIEISGGQVSTKGGVTSSTNASGSKLTNLKEIEITCYKSTKSGIIKKKIKDVKPSCPSGYKPM